MTTTTTHHLRTIATRWTDLRDALGAPAQIGAFGLGLRGYLAALEEPDLEEAAARRALERDPAQIGERPVPIRLAVYDTMRLVEAGLVECADQIAHSSQHPVMQPMAPHIGFHATERARKIAEADRQRRNALAAADATDPQRWRFTGYRTATLAALWLCARVEGIRGPQRPLDEQQLRYVARVAQGAAERVERALDIAASKAGLERPCECGGRIEVHGGAGAIPVAHCTSCGRIWTEQGLAA
ncbi:hypothetical protein NLX86_06600 [Streptomyces sp. A3M-1-3]|uniref:hypothetical protein n=1 Tax=Streptomyces sp. A3M-1-3 TaxID=2962044 RepID=UPI0020B6B8DE|nr:hypothetical protein [Streptomyces sp. A3M-1-3]MCP3817816.1 hypothetical protein [Streptomyces sp. A3M-1-3]